MIPVKESAKKLKVSDRTIRRWIADGKLESIKINGVVRIPDEEVRRVTQEKE